MDIKEICQPISDQLDSVGNLLESSIRESEEHSILAISDSLTGSIGKRLRPALVILSKKTASAGKISNSNQNETIKLATAVELIHIASLIHDDVIDNADLRRSKPSANAIWGNHQAVIYGDFVYSRAFDLILECQNLDVMECICKTMRLMCEGELAQVCQRGNFDLTEDNYLSIIKKKTAALFAACCQIGAIISDHNLATQKLLKDFGMDLGIAFQMVDDYKDIICEQKVLGKLPGQDVISGEMTLPLIYLLQNSDESEKKQLKDILRSKGNDADQKELKKIFIESGIDSLIKEKILYYVERSKSKITNFENSDYKNSLNSLADHIAQEVLCRS